MQALYIFSAALLVRILLGYIFYGSIDVSAYIGITEHALNGTLVQHPGSIWCSNPLIPFYLWLCSFLSIKTQLPVAFCFKIIPIIFDSLLAVLVYDFVKKLRPQQALYAGLLYAFSPIALIITCIHGQWDAMPLLFFLLALFVRDCYQDSFKKYFVYGTLFAFSFLLKPIALIFIPFFFVPWPSLKQTLGRWWGYLLACIVTKLALLAGFFAFFKLNKTYSIDMLFDVTYLCEAFIGLALLVGVLVLIVVQRKPWKRFSVDFQKYLGYQFIALAGTATVVAVCFVALGWYGLNPVRMIDKVLRYFNQGNAVFGLPFAYPFNQGFLSLILKNRIWLMGLIGVLAVMYYKNRINIYHGIVASLMIIFSFSGLSPQYFLWVVPLLLITGFYRAAALLNGLCAVFFIFYYMNPFSNPEVLYQSMLSFAPLRAFSWLLPPAFLTDLSWLYWVRLPGNYALPALCFGMAGYIVLYACTERFALQQEKALSVIKNVYVLFSLGLTTLIAALMLLVDQTGFAAQFKDSVAEKTTWYDIQIVDGFMSGRYGGINPFNIIFVFLALTTLWCFIAWRKGRGSTGSPRTDL